METRKPRFGTETERRTMRRREKADITQGEVDRLYKRIEQLERERDELKRRTGIARWAAFKLRTMLVRGECQHRAEVEALVDEFAAPPKELGERESELDECSCMTGCERCTGESDG